LSAGVLPRQEDKMSLIEQVKKAKTQSKKRKFKQTVDLIVNLKGLDLKKPENRFNSEFFLPHGRGKAVKVAVIVDSLAADAKGHADYIIRKEDIPILASKKKELKRIARSYDWFLGEVTLMADIGKQLGIILGPRGKMPKPVPPKVKIEPFIERARNTVRVALRESPVIQTCVGSEDMSDEHIAANAEAVFNFRKEKLPKGRNNVRSAMVKLTMGKPVKIEV
jgi:large subunit ribosomal protein L1